FIKPASAANSPVWRRLRALGGPRASSARRYASTYLSFTTCPMRHALGDILSQARGGERVARGRVAAVVAAAEPRHALLRRAMAERLRADDPARHLLQAVVADRRRRRHRLLDVARLEQAAALRVARPHAGEAVGLQLEPHRQP